MIGKSRNNAAPKKAGAEAPASWSLGGRRKRSTARRRAGDWRNTQHKAGKSAGYVRQSSPLLAAASNELRRLDWTDRRVEVGTKLVARNARGTLDLDDPLGRNLVAFPSENGRFVDKQDGTEGFKGLPGGFSMLSED